MSPVESVVNWTTAQLLSANLHRYQDHPIVVIIKVDANSDGTKEYNAHYRAIKDSPEFARDHLVVIARAAPPAKRTPRKSSA